MLGTITCSIEDMSATGVSIRLDEKVDFFVMMKLDIRIHGEGGDTSMPSLPVEVVRVNDRSVALKFSDALEELWSPEQEVDLVSESYRSVRLHGGQVLELA